MDHSSHSDHNGDSTDNDLNRFSSMRSSDVGTSRSTGSSFSPPSHLKACSGYTTQFSLPKLTRLIASLTLDQKNIIKDCGFASILALRCTSIPNSLILWLARHYDAKTRSVKAPCGKSFKVDAITVHQILGIPYGGKAFPCKSSSCAKTIIQKDTQSIIAAKIDDLIAIVSPALVGDKFARIFLLIVFGIFLFPSSSNKVSNRYYEAISVVKAIRSYDWCTAVAEYLHKGIMHFHNNASKGNMCGRATFPGCLFLFAAAYFDYLVINQQVVQPTVPRICVWDDKAIARFREAELTTEAIEFKPIDSTMFTKDKINPSTQRGFNLLPVNPTSCSQPSSDHEAEVFSHPSTPVSKTTNYGSAQPNRRDHIDIESARKVMPGSSQLSLRVLCGEVTHPEVDSFIKETIGSSAHAEVVQQLNDMCQSFFKESISQYIKSVEHVIVNQSCEMVKSFCSGLQQKTKEAHASAGRATGRHATENDSPAGCSTARHPTQNVSPMSPCDNNLHSPQQEDPATEVAPHPDTPRAHSPRHAQEIHSDVQQQSQGANRSAQCPAGTPQTDNGSPCVNNVESTQQEDLLTKEGPQSFSTCGHSALNSHEENCNLQQQRQDANISSVSSAGAQPSPMSVDTNNLQPHRQEHPMTEEAPHQLQCNGCYAEYQTGFQHICTAMVLVSPLSKGTEQSGGQTFSLHEDLSNSDDSSGPVPVAVIYNVSSDDSNEDGAPTEEDSVSSHVRRQKSNATSSPSKSKRSIIFDMPAPSLQSPKKKLRSMSKSPAATSGPTEANYKVASNTDISPEPTLRHVHSSIHDASTRVLSDLGHRKRALKTPAPLLRGQNVRGPKVSVSGLDKEIYHLVTRKLDKNDLNPECAHIGRMNINLKEFAETMRPTKWVGTFFMNVYTEALSYDQRNTQNLKIRKGFLTSAEVDHLKVNGINTDLLLNKLDPAIIGFKLNEVDMVMIPVLHGLHWWLLIANIRDYRFDVLSSTPITDEVKKVTAHVRQNFEMVFGGFYGPQARTHIKDFTTAYQDAPQQTTNHDCGIFVMNFMRSWDGRRVSPMDNNQLYNYRVQAAVYVLCHEANKSVLPAIKKLIQKHQDQTMRKKDQEQDRQQAGQEGARRSGQVPKPTKKVYKQKQQKH